MNKKTKGLRTFLVIWVGQLASLIGSGFIGFALGVWIYERTGQAMPFALTSLFSILPRLLLAPIAGVVADRWNRKKIMLISDSLAGLVTLATAILLLTGQIDVWMIYVISFMSACFGSFQDPAYRASIVLLVPKKQLTRANSMIQMGQAIQNILTPLTAGILFTTIGMGGIIIIDIVTYVFAMLTLLFVHIPQPTAQLEEKEQKKPSVWQDFVFGWRYLVERHGLFGLLIYFAFVNFFLNISGFLISPMILAFSNPASLGVGQTVIGAGMLVGSLVLSAWGGPKKNLVKAIIGFIVLVSLGFLITGLRPSLVVISAGMFMAMFFLPMASGPSSALFATKVAPDVQGRVFATRSMISQSMMPLAYLLGGFLADTVFEPLLIEGGLLSDTFVAEIVGVGPGRGMGFMMVCSGLILFVVSLVAFLNPHIRHLETEIPDAVTEEQQTDLESTAEEGMASQPVQG